MPTVYTVTPEPFSRLDDLIALSATVVLKSVCVVGTPSVNTTTTLCRFPPGLL